MITIYLVFNARRSFKSAALNKEYNHGLCFLSIIEGYTPIQATCEVLSDLPHSQHRQAIIELDIRIPLTTSSPSSRWNLKRANCASYSDRLDKCMAGVIRQSNTIKGSQEQLSTLQKYHTQRIWQKRFTWMG